MLDQLITDLPAGPISLARIVSATGSAPGAVGTTRCWSTHRVR